MRRWSDRETEDKVREDLVSYIIDEVDIAMLDAGFESERITVTHQTPDQFKVKSAMGIVDAHRRHFHWKFWKPKDCIGGKVYFGYYYTCYTVDNDA